MKYKSKIYAQGLVNALLDKRVDVKKVVPNFLALLQKNGDLRKAKEIVVLAEQLFSKKTGARKVTLETARKLGVNKITSVFKKNDFVKEKINPELIAGLKIIINNDMQLDFSLKKKLEEVF